MALGLKKLLNRVTVATMNFAFSYLIFTVILFSYFPVSCLLLFLEGIPLRRLLSSPI